MKSAKSIAELERELESRDEAVRWAAAAELGEYVVDHPERVWPIVLRFGSSETEDMRQAIATNVLEHLLEHHFDRYFPLLEQEINRGNELLRDSLRLCWKLGKPLDSSRLARWNALTSRG